MIVNDVLHYNGERTALEERIIHASIGETQTQVFNTLRTGEISFLVVHAVSVPIANVGHFQSCESSQITWDVQLSAQARHGPAGAGITSPLTVFL
jgi:hypothetical protein